MTYDNTHLMFKSWYKLNIVFNLYFAFTHLIFLFHGNHISFQNTMICLCCFLLLTFVHLKINIIQWVYFYFSLWPITCHVQNYYDILQFRGFSPKQKLFAFFKTKNGSLTFVSYTCHTTTHLNFKLLGENTLVIYSVDKKLSKFDNV
jgi:hypothetical protein